MQLQAISAGNGVQSDRFTGVVHSTFRRACNLCIDRGPLIALLARELGNAPHGVSVDLPPGLAFVDHVQAGQRVGCRASVLRIAGSGLAVDLSTAVVWRSELAEVDLARPATLAAWQVAWRALQRRRQANPLLHTVHRRGRALAAASRALDIERARAAIERLIGCGPGLTPAGDDLIVGFQAGLFASRGADPARRRFLGELGVAVTVAAAATGEISGTCLQHAGAGSVAEPLERLVGAIGAGLPAPEVARAADRALSVGHTSGGDGVLGLLLAMHACSSARGPGHG